VGDEAIVFRQKLLGEEGSIRRGVVKAKKRGMSPKFGTTSSHVFTQSRETLQWNLEFTFRLVETSVSRYHNCCIDGGTSPEYFGYYLVQSSKFGQAIMFQLP
jgi:predicted SPOUT superfamily RNA methylase MTH1